MWWVFVQKENSDNIAVYYYSRESEDLDGVIIYNKSTETVEVSIPCSEDKNNEWCQDKAVGKFISCVIDENYPAKRRVVIG